MHAVAVRDRGEHHERAAPTQGLRDCLNHRLAVVVDANDDGHRSGEPDPQPVHPAPEERGRDTDHTQEDRGQRGQTGNLQCDRHRCGARTGLGFERAGTALDDADRPDQRREEKKRVRVVVAPPERGEAQAEADDRQPGHHGQRCAGLPDAVRAKDRGAHDQKQRHDDDDRRYDTGVGSPNHRRPFGRR